MPALPEPQFVERDPQKITAELIAQYESLTGRTLYPAQLERVLIDVLAYRETLVREAIQEAAKQNLVAFAQAPMIDYLGQLVMVERLPAQPARTQLRWALQDGGTIVIPAGTRVESADGAVAFLAEQDLYLDQSRPEAVTAATCSQAGEQGNGWQPGQLSRLAEPMSSRVKVSNITASSGGSAVEDTERLRERIKLAPESFSVAGAAGAYRFHALRAHPDVADVGVHSPVPGEVVLTVLSADGPPSAELLATVLGACSAETVRPLTDYVRAVAPTVMPYELKARLTLYRTADAPSVMASAQRAAESFVAGRARKLGPDVVPSQLIAALSVFGVYLVDLISPAAVLEVPPTGWAQCTSITLEQAGFSDD
jgi:phage-related baseplate assembly protein